MPEQRVTLIVLIHFSEELKLIFHATEERNGVRSVTKILISPVKYGKSEKRGKEENRN